MKCCIFNRITGDVIQSVSSSLKLPFLWGKDVKYAYDFKNRSSAESFAQERLKTLDNYSIVEINNLYNIRPDPNDDGEESPLKRPYPRGRRGPRFRHQRGTVRTVENPNALDPEKQQCKRKFLTVLNENNVRLNEPRPGFGQGVVIFREWEEALMDTLTGATVPNPAIRRVPHGDANTPTNDERVRLARVPIRPQPGIRPQAGDMVEYGWYDAGVEREVADYMRDHPTTTRDEAITQVFNGPLNQ